MRFPPRRETLAHACDRSGHGGSGCCAFRERLAYPRRHACASEAGAGVVPLALVQMTCSDRPRREPRHGRGPHRAGRPRRSAGDLPPGARSARATSVRPRTRHTSPWRSPSPAPPPRRSPTLAAGARRGHHRLPLRAPRRGPVPQHGGHHRRRRRDRRALPQDAHPRRPALLREVLLHAGRPRLRGGRDALRTRGNVDLLGPVVSRGRSA